MNAQRPDFQFGHLIDKELPTIDKVETSGRGAGFRETTHIGSTDQEIQRRAVVAVSGVVTSAGNAFMSGFLKVLLLVTVLGAIPLLANAPDLSGVALFGIGVLLFVGAIYQIFLRCYRK
jgi:hypothetical protein